MWFSQVKVGEESNINQTIKLIYAGFIHQFSAFDDILCAIKNEIWLTLPVVTVGFTSCSLQHSKVNWQSKAHNRPENKTESLVLKSHFFKLVHPHECSTVRGRRTNSSYAKLPCKYTSGLFWLITTYLCRSVMELN